MRVVDGLGKRASSARTRALLRRMGASIGPRLTAYGVPIVTMVPGSTLELGGGVTLCSSPRFTALGVSHPVVMRTLLPGASIFIGNKVGISGGSICAAGNIYIGDCCLIGADVVIADTNFHPLRPTGRRDQPVPQPADDDSITIEANVFVGARAIILPGVRIGRDSVIGAGSVVTKPVPPGVVAAGTPCRVLRAL